MSTGNIDKLDLGLARLAHRKPMVESADAGKDNASDLDILKAAACDLLTYANEFHVYHWNAKNNFIHELLGEAYDLMRDTSDRLAERYLSLSDVEGFVPEGDFGSDQKDWNAGKERVLERMESILDGMNKAYAETPGLAKFGGIGNIFADFDEKLGVLIYKCKRFNG